MRRVTQLILCLSFLTSPMVADAATSQPYEPIQYLFEQRLHPPREIHIARIDLADPAVSLHVSRAGDDPDGDGHWQTTLLPLSEVAERQEWELAINGDFFTVPPAEEREQKARYARDRPASVSGPAMTDGMLWAQPAKPRPALIIDHRGSVAIAVANTPPNGSRQVIAGSDVLVKDGRNVVARHDSFARTNHPRTAVGIADQGRTLVFLVVDGRRVDKIGMSLGDLADEMIQLGCESALNLDGGGSSAMVWRDPASNEIKVMNSPSDGQERPIGNALGVNVAEKISDQQKRR